MVVKIKNVTYVGGLIDAILNDSTEVEATTIQKAVIEIFKLKSKEAEDYKKLI